jgi:hypothetical protein
MAWWIAAVPLLVAACSDDGGKAPAAAAPAKSASPSASPSPSAPAFRPTDERFKALDAALEPVMKRFGDKVTMQQSHDPVPGLSFKPCAGYALVPNEDVSYGKMYERTYYSTAAKDDRSLDLTIGLFPDAAGATAAYDEIGKAADACPKDAAGFFPGENAEIKVERATAEGVPVLVVTTRAIPASKKTQMIIAHAYCFTVRGANVLAGSATLRRATTPSGTPAERDAARALVLQFCPAAAKAAPV